MEYLVVTVQEDTDYWLVKGGRDPRRPYRWQRGDAGFRAAHRFFSRAEAEVVIDSGFLGAGRTRAYRRGGVVWTERRALWVCSPLDHLFAT